MGSIRTLLAISVVFSHTYGFLLVGGMLAVQLFYVISGFLISFVLTEAKTYVSVRSFYTNRFLRLFPLYWIVASLTLAAFAVNTFLFQRESAPFEVLNQLDPIGRIALAVVNLGIFGQDLIMFTGVRGGDFMFVSDFRDSEVAVWEGLLVPQAWTLGVELSFYVIAPYVLVRKLCLVFLLLASLSVRILLIYFGVGLDDPWTYRFFPAELALFLLGALSHQVWGSKLRRMGVINQKTSQFVFIFLLLYCATFFLLPYRTLNTFILIVIFVVALPFLLFFSEQKNGIAGLES
jgi:peptidoglycan/LPS O-acetylase OafA/YrhL